MNLVGQMEPRVLPRVVYLGTPDVAVPPLLALHEAGFEIPLVISRPDKRRGRGSELTPSPLKAAALDLGLAVTDNIEEVLSAEADIGVVVAFGQIIKPHILEHLPMVNLHFSLLPRWRGAAPVERAILAGDGETGVCLMAVAEGLDTGGVYRRVDTPINPGDTLDSLRRRLVALGSEMVVDALSDGLGEPEPQEGEPVYAHKLSPDDFKLNFDQSASEVLRIVRLGRAWTRFRGKRLKVIDAEIAVSDEPGRPRDLLPGHFRGTKKTSSTATSGGTANNGPGNTGPANNDPNDATVVACAAGTGLALLQVQPEGKAKMSAKAWLNGAQPGAEDRLG